jgi:hypothetical protein
VIFNCVNCRGTCKVNMWRYAWWGTQKFHKAIFTFLT